jgi:hypothetical protein
MMKFPKPVPRLVDRTASKRLADQAWTACKRLVDARDGYRCRCCQRKTVTTLALIPARAEHHHLLSRRLLPKAFQTDPRLVILVCASCHGHLTRHEVAMAADVLFWYDGRPYPNADFPVTFLPSASCPTSSIESEPCDRSKDDCHD